MFYICIELNIVMPVWAISKNVFNLCLFLFFFLLFTCLTYLQDSFSNSRSNHQLLSLQHQTPRFSINIHSFLFSHTCIFNSSCFWLLNGIVRIIMFIYILDIDPEIQSDYYSSTNRQPFESNKLTHHYRNCARIAFNLSYDQSQ